MPPKKRVRRTSPGGNSMEEATAISQGALTQRRSSRPTRGVGGHATQLQKTGEMVIAPTRRRKEMGFEISGSEENPMAPSQIRKKVNAKNSNQASSSLQLERESAHVPHLHVARPSDRFGFKLPPSTDRQGVLSVATQSICHSRESIRGDAAMQEDVTNDRQEDSYDLDGSENSTHEHYSPGQEDSVDEFGQEAGDNFTGHDDMAFDDPLARRLPTSTGGNGDRNGVNQTSLSSDNHNDVAYDVLERHQAKNGRRRPPSPTHLSSSSRGHTLAANSSSTYSASSRQRLSHSRPLVHAHDALARSKSPYQYSSENVSRRRYLATTSHRPSPQRSPACSVISSGCMQPSSRGHSLSRSPSSQPIQSNSPAPTSIHSRSPMPEPRNEVKRGNKQMNPSKLGFYPPSWQAFLQAAKLEMRLQAVLTHPIPEHQNALQLANEVLGNMLWEYRSKNMKVESDYYPKYDAQMSRLLCDDLFTFRAELKKVIIPIAKRLYGIFPNESMHTAQHSIANTASNLIKSGNYLRFPDSSEGKYKNFVSQVLKDACLDFYYGNGRKALKLTKQFRTAIPINGLILVAAVTKGVLAGFRESSSDKVPDLTADKCRSNSIRKSVDKLMEVPERRRELEEMLGEWLMVGMMGELHSDSDGSAGGGDDVNVIL